MQQRQIEEMAFDGFDGLVDALRDPFAAKGQRFCIAGKRARRVAEHISGKLIQHYDQGQPPVRRDREMIQAPGKGLRDGVAEHHRYPPVKGSVRVKPPRDVLLEHSVGRVDSAHEYEVENGINCRWHGSSVLRTAERHFKRRLSWSYHR